MGSPKSAPHIPQEIIFNILIWYDVKTLSRFMCVSKTWLSMISSPDFIRSHRQIPSPNHRLILGYNKKPDGNAITFYTCSPENYKSLEDEQQINVNLDLDLKKEFCFRLLFVGSCNGLCCIATSHNNIIILLNPSTRKWRKIPKAVIDDYNHYHNPDVVYGFGYDDSCDDYKVVYLEHLYSKQMLVVRVYSLRTNSWTENRQYYSMQVRWIIKGTRFVNRKLHWTAFKAYNSQIVLSYDLKTGLLGELLGPEDGYDISKLAVYKGCLCLKGPRDIWFMSEYGVQESWKKIQFSSNEIGLYGTNDHNSNGVMLDDARKLAKWSPKHQQRKHKIKVVHYIESLVSPTFGEDK